jgi:hypothetical protein
MKNVNCICTHTTCPMWGNCKECTDFHKGKPYCKSGTMRRTGLRIVFAIYDGVQSVKKNLRK